MSRDDEVRRLPFQEAAQCRAILHRADAVALLLEIFADKIANVAMVVDDGDVGHEVHDRSRTLNMAILILRPPQDARTELYQDIAETL